MTRSFWRHLVALLLFAAVLSAVQYVPHLHRIAPGADAGTFVRLFAIGIAQSLFVVLPMVAGIAIGTAGTGRPGVRAAARLLAILLGIMVVADMVASPALERARAAEARRAPATWPLARDTFDVRFPIVRDGAIRTGVALALGNAPATPPELTGHYRADPRRLGIDLLFAYGMMLIPFIGMGIVLGATSWVRQRVTFRSARDEVVARWVLAWLLTGSTVALFVNWPLGMQYRISVGRASFWEPVLVSLPFLALAALGWRAAAREPAQSAA